ncbi:PLDc N-terminal domain-containing protein [Terribacillus sp. DMT04]|uniref:PLDc N-terminal domain-containing protein n=1 Tax=Terribacillus sp. DMT04 TaxID=2850441 RepID=UPI001C2BCD94|nr:PLDc N-terminal domain-containing protein [Terribacillus sp. DMT04]QXE01793.1 PLDc N-terminal domain-containing protein [Terribacillus sp. DMT04]
MENTFALLLPVLIVQFILLVTALMSCIRAEHTLGPKWLWIIIIVCVSIIGPVLFFVAGKRRDR